MPFFDFLKKDFFKRSKPSEEERKEKRVLTIDELVKELGVAREGVITSYEAEENPDDLGPETYIEMQKNDGEVQAIVRLFTLPIISTPVHIIPDKNDKGERDFIETVFTAPPRLGGMTTPLPFIIADMTRAIFEGFRLYEKVARIIEEGKYKGFVGWKKLAPRDSRTIKLKADEHGGFAGARQEASFGGKLFEVDIPPEKCMLFTFQKEKHWLYGESILKTAFYHYDKKHKLYYIAHKKAEIESTGLKILRINNTMTPDQKRKAEEGVDQIGVNSRITLPPGVDLEIERGGGGYDPLPLIEHHNLMMARSALCQAIDQVKYAYPYGKGTTSSQFLIMAIESIMRQMEATLNTYAVAPLIDFNFGTSAYPKIKFEKISDVSKQFLMDVFDQVMKAKVQLPKGFIDQVIDETAKTLNLKWAFKDEEENKEALKEFERGKLEESNKLKIKAPPTPKTLKTKLLKVKKTKENLEKCYQLGREFARTV
ncbi:MAG: phage portal protein family protein [Candidatus Hodarchaeales archaeon]